jgi:hypothetical protein
MSPLLLLKGERQLMESTIAFGARHGRLAGLAANAILLTLPPLLFDLVFWNSLPKAFSLDQFWKDIPLAMVLGERIGQVFVFGFPVLMRIRLDTPRQRLGLRLYGAGLVAYYASWFALILFPDSVWSTSVIGFVAPAYTPLPWLAGIALMSDGWYVRRIPYRWWYYLAGSLVFLAFHVSHAFLAFTRTF